VKTLDRERPGRSFRTSGPRSCGPIGTRSGPDYRRLLPPPARPTACYARQGYEGRFDRPRAARSTTLGQQLQQGFHAANEREYGHRLRGEAAIVTIRVLGVRPARELQWARPRRADGDPTAHTLDLGRSSSRPSAADSVLRRALLLAGGLIEGPAVLEITTRRPSSRPGSSPSSTVREHIVIDCPRVQVERGDLSTPILMPDRRRLSGAIAKEMSGCSPHELLRRSSASRRSRRRDFDADGNDLRRVGLDAEVQWAYAEDRQGWIQRLVD